MNKRVYAFIVLLMLTIQGCLAQSKDGAKNNWVINEIYTSDSPKRYGLFLELYNPSNAKISSDLYVSTSKSNPYQFRLKSRSHFIPDWRQKGYRTCKISAVRFKSRTIKMNYTDTLYLFKRDRGYNFVLQDAFPVLWNDSSSIGRCGDRICRFNIPTPGRKNQNVAPNQYMPRKLYRVSLGGGIGTGNNTSGFLKDYTSDKIGYVPSFIIKVQKVVNRRLYYTTTTATIFHQGFSFKSHLEITTSQGFVTRNANGYHSSFGLTVGKDIGLFLTPKFDISAGASLILYSYSRQVFHYSQSILHPDGSTLRDDDIKEVQLIENYQLPVLAFSSGLNYEVTAHCKIELLYAMQFRTFQKSETIYYQSFNIGVSKSFRHKGRGYKEPLLWK